MSRSRQQDGQASKPQHVAAKQSSTPPVQPLHPLQQRKLMSEQLLRQEESEQEQDDIDLAAKLRKIAQEDILSCDEELEASLHP